MKFLKRLCRDERASTLIETAFVAPVLVAMTLGGVEISSMVARQTELQTISANAMEIIMASAPTNQVEADQTMAEVKAYIAQRSGLTASNAGPEIGEGQATVYMRWRCGNNSERQAEKGCANEAQTESVFLVIYMRDSYSPVWTEYGIGSNFEYKVKRSVQIG
ncbi:TadE/TadG family type IV pilus assembly protein [Croceicoccus naphthovorans]|uniref:Uncharacterized protein n=1 Tax=Croceicoccus naphthovorans TaxID=1348774 RepID=A0A0G3XEJ4_9SPHN|nr:TadE/TadG family type IV pilus assembly protein [Croceicoccus naphthovorans]AKM09990.1 hypothetical protein AB433_08385 [Croceicoccus naphthovorans]MBB3991138.1 Flp pilus assembly protein TadG [Croceicoccus naphthovorans]